jgi:hypothetical protein
MGKRILLSAAIAVLGIAAGVALPSVACAIGGGVGGINVGAPSGLQVNPGSNLNLGPPPVFNIQRTPGRFRDLNLAGQVGIDLTKLPPDAKIVRLYLDGREIPMRLDTELHSGTLVFEPEPSYGRDLYRAVLSKRVEVVGAPQLRDALRDAAANRAQTQVEGYVFNLSSPYLVLKSVKPEP